MSVQADAHEIARHMFVDTADGNYILARIAFFEHLQHDFFWLSLHAVEKYYKAILLMNGRSAKRYGHDLQRLHAAVMQLDPRLPIGPLTDPGIEDLHWRDQSVDSYLKRLAKWGSAENRYAAYGYVARMDDLCKVDQLVWSIRRCCRTFVLQLTGSSGNHRKIDSVAELLARPTWWKLHDFSPIEKLMSDKGHERRRDSFLRLNTPFAPDRQFAVPSWWAAASNPPLSEHFRLLKEPGASAETKSRAAHVLRWALDNIQFSKCDQDEIRQALAQHGP